MKMMVVIGMPATLVLVFAWFVCMCHFCRCRCCSFYYGINVHYAIDSW